VYVFTFTNNKCINTFVIVLQKVIEKLNKSGVLYKPAAAAASGNNEPEEEEVDSFENGPYEKKEFMYKEESGFENGVEPVIDMTQPDEDVEKKKPDAEVVNFLHIQF
jgi:hypothetical protein